MILELLEQCCVRSRYLWIRGVFCVLWITLVLGREVGASLWAMGEMVV